MGPFVSYMLQVSVVMTLLYLAYKWLMSPSTFHRMNRFTLLGIYAVSSALPFAMALFQRAAQGASVNIEVGLPLMTEFIRVSVSEEAAIDWARVALWVYIAGVLAVALFSVAGLSRMAVIISSGRHTRRDGYVEVVTDRAPGPFSWGRYVVLRPADCDADMAMVTAHELTHLHRLHWLDLLVAQVTAVLQWFSPVAWLMMRDLQDVHEFEVDAVVAGENAVRYQMMLLKKTAGAKFPAFADSLNHSQIKKRITMMMTKKSSPSRRVAALALPAAAALAVFMLSQPAVASVADRLAGARISGNANAVGASDGKVNETVENLQFSGRVISIRGAESDSRADSATPTDVPAEAVSETGSPQEKSETKGADVKPVYFLDGKKFDGDLKELDRDKIESMTVVKNDPAYPQGKIMIVTKGSGVKAPEDGVRLVTEKIAEYRGGMSALMSFLKENIKFPAEDLTESVNVLVIVQFTIGPDGGVTEARVARGATGQLSEASVSRGLDKVFDAEALRVVNLSSGHWEPATEDGRPVASQFTLPVLFRN